MPEPMTRLETVKVVVDIVQGVVVVGAAIVGGLWALSRLNRERTDEAALAIELSTQAASLPGGNENLVTVTVQLTNRGMTKIGAKSARDANGLAFDDGPEKLYHSGSLQIRKLDLSKGIGRREIDWFEAPPLQSVPQLSPELNLLTEYQNPKVKERVEFWMEPGETYYLRIPVILPAGVYVAKVTFVAADPSPDWVDELLKSLRQTTSQKEPDQSFWSQVYAFSVPATTPA